MIVMVRRPRRTQAYEIANVVTKGDSAIEKITEPIADATKYGVPLGVGASVIGANVDRNLESMVTNPSLGEGVRDTLNRLGTSFFESKFDSMPEILMDSTLTGVVTLSALTGLAGYKGFQKFKEVSKKPSMHSRRIKQLRDLAKTGYYTGLYAATIPLQARLGHMAANSIQGYDVWGGLVKPALTYVTNL